MTGRLADVGADIAGIRQLGAVVNAIRGIAAARARQARGQLASVDAYAATIAGAIGRALGLMPAFPPDDDAAGPVRPALVVFGAEQGFAGAFSQRVLDAVGADLARSMLFLIGTKGGMVARERAVAVAWNSAMPAHSPGIPKLADRIADALYRRIASGEIGRLDVAFSRREPGEALRVERRRLFPLDLTAFPRAAEADAALVTLPPDALLRALAADYLHAQLCHAALHAFAAENEARMEAMAAAHGQIEHRLADLQASERQMRQAEITAEIIELAAGETASRS